MDFYELLINCQNSVDPVKQLQIEALRWHAPILSVFATFYPVIVKFLLKLNLQINFFFNYDSAATRQNKLLVYFSICVLETRMQLQ